MHESIGDDLPLLTYASLLNTCLHLDWLRPIRLKDHCFASLAGSIKGKAISAEG